MAIALAAGLSAGRYAEAQESTEALAAAAQNPVAAMYSLPFQNGSCPPFSQDFGIDG
jgi:hypothetical protein